MTEAVRSPSSLPSTRKAELRKSQWLQRHAQTFSLKTYPTCLRMHRTTRVAAVGGAPSGNFWIIFFLKCQVSPTPSLCPHGNQTSALLSLSVQPFIYPNWSFPQTLAPLKELWTEWGWDHLQMRVGLLTPRLSVFDPSYNWFGFRVTCENVILIKELHLRLETHFQQEPQLGKEETSMFLCSILSRLSSNISWPISASTLQPPCLCKGQTEHHWKQLKSPKTATEILISQNTLHHTVRGKHHSDKCKKPSW